MTIKEWLADLASSNTSTEKDSEMMERLLKRVGETKARVVGGIVYLNGVGTMEAPPMDIHSFAKGMLKAS